MRTFYFPLLLSLILLSAMGCKSSKYSKKVFDVQKNEVFIDSIMTHALENNFFPGAQIAAGDKNALLILKNYGYHDYSKKQFVKLEDVYDLASMSKVLGATLVAMRLVGDGKMKLDDELGQLVPIYKNTPVADITVFEFLTHTSGLKPFITFYRDLLSTPDDTPLLSNEPSDGYSAKFDNMYVNDHITYDPKYIVFEPQPNYIQVYKNMWLNPEFYNTIPEQIALARTHPKGSYVYSDLNLILVQKMMETITDKTLEVLTREIYNELGIKDIGYNPLKWTSEENVIPTEIDNLFRKDTLKGYVHDETAAILGGVSGNAGLFANAASIAVVCQMLINKGNYQGKQIVKRKVLRQFTKSPLAKKAIYRGIGFDKRKTSPFFNKDDFGHTGYTGTFFFMNSQNNRYFILLSNRVHPTRTNRLMYKDDLGAKIWRHIND